MQKKNYSSETASSAWQDNLNKQKRQESAKKYGIWGAIILASLVGLAALVFLTNKATSTTTTPVENKSLPKVSSSDIVVGDPKAKVTITEYGDLECPACASYNPIVNKVLSDYNGKVRLVFRFFPLVSIHKNALISGQAAYAGWKLGKFTEMKDILFDKQSEWENLADPREVFQGYASSLGLDTKKFNEIMNSDEAKNRVANGEKEALGLGLNSTPSFFIGDKYFEPSGYDSFKDLIDQDLKGS